MPYHPESHKTLRWLAFLAAIVILCLIVINFADRTLRHTSSGVERSLDKVLATLTRSDTRIVEGRAEITSRSEINELALLDLRMSATRTFENESYILQYLPAGTKRITARGEYRITAGYRLTPGVSLHLENATHVARFPKPVILGVELIDLRFLDERDGWANRIQPADRSALTNELRQQMRREATNSGILEKTETTLASRLRELLGTPDIRIEPIPEPAP